MGGYETSGRPVKQETHSNDYANVGNLHSRRPLRGYGLPAWQEAFFTRLCTADFLLSDTGISSHRLLTFRLLSLSARHLLVPRYSPCRRFMGSRPARQSAPIHVCLLLFCRHDNAAFCWHNWFCLHHLLSNQGPRLSHRGRGRSSHGRSSCSCTSSTIPAARTISGDVSCIEQNF